MRDGSSSGSYLSVKFSNSAGESSQQPCLSVEMFSCFSATAAAAFCPQHILIVPALKMPGFSLPLSVGQSLL